ncbi:uncharacterized protein LOC143536278 [Bidens hawaiensis]|uniref:uncharacterized protein LOC143536278 n=1 Tax=Bidens hawaiensis TaxID=980011 RepID=UPI00404B33E7
MWQGNRMQAYVRKPCIPKHDVWLAENKSLIVRKASLGENMSTYKYIDCPHKLCFTAETHLSNSYEFEGHLYGLKFVTFDDIKAKNFPQNDVIGHVTKFFNNKNSFLREAQHQNRRTMEFCDLRMTTLSSLPNMLPKTLMRNILLLFSSSQESKNVYVNNSYGNVVSRLLINDYLYEMVEYKRRLLKVSGQVNVEVKKPVGSSMLLNVKNEFSEEGTAKSVIILGTVKAIVSNKEWYYVGCKRCGRKVSSSFVDGVKVYECKIADCNSQGVTVGPRFRIPVRV